MVDKHPKSSKSEVPNEVGEQQSKSFGLAPSGKPHEIGARPAPLGIQRARTAGERLTEKAQAKSRAYAWISKFAGCKKNEAQRQKWIVDMLIGVEAAYRGIILDLNDEQNVLSLELHHEKSIHDEVRAESNKLSARVRTESAVKTALVEAANARKRAVEEELVLVKEVVQAAERAAQQAGTQCRELCRAVMSVSEADAAARKRLAMRAYQLREAVVHCRSDLRHHRTVGRRQRLLLANAAHKRERLTVEAKHDRQESTNALALLEAENGTLKQQILQLRTQLAERGRECAASGTPQRHTHRASGAQRHEQPRRSCTAA